MKLNKSFPSTFLWIAELNELLPQTSLATRKQSNQRRILREPRPRKNQENNNKSQEKKFKFDFTLKREKKHKCPKNNLLCDYYYGHNCPLLYYAVGMAAVGGNNKKSKKVSPRPPSSLMKTGSFRWKLDAKQLLLAWRKTTNFASFSAFLTMIIISWLEVWEPSGPQLLVGRSSLKSLQAIFGPFESA